MNIQESINHLRDLAVEADAELVTQVQLAFEGAELTVHWTPNGDDLPRECHIFFGAKDGISDCWLWAWVIDPVRFLNGMEEGLADDVVADHSTLMVESMEDVSNYLLNRPYKRVMRLDKST